MWMSAQSFGVKVTATVGNLVLMALLFKEDWGVFALAIAVKALLDITGRIGMRQILVQRHAKFDRWATPAFWMALTAGMIASMLIIGIGPLMADQYDQPDLVWMLVILAANSPILAMGMVPQAKLQSQMRFKAIASIEFTAHVGALLATVILAALNFGPFSFVIPLPFMELWRSAAFWYLARPRIRLTPQFRRWKLLMADTSYILVTDVLSRVVSQADYLILGLFHPIALVGAYSVAFRFSTQSMSVVTGNLRQALLPALSKLQSEPTRQLRAFLRAGRMLTAVYTPVALLQAITCEPLLRLLYGEKYLESIPVLQILSISMMLRAINGPSVSLLRSQGRYRTNMLLQIIYTLVFVIVAMLVASTWAAVELAIGVSVVAVAFGPIQTYVAIRSIGGSWSDVVGIYVQPVIAGSTAFALTWTAGLFIPTNLSDPVRYCIEIVIYTLLGVGLYAAIVRWIMPALWSDLLRQFEGVNPLPLRRFSRKAHQHQMRP